MKIFFRIAELLSLFRYCITVLKSVSVARVSVMPSAASLATIRRLCAISSFAILLTACSKEGKPVDASKYQSIELNVPAYVQPDKALKNDSIKIPHLSSNAQWAASSSVTAGIPQNIAVGQGKSILDYRTFKVHKSFDRSYHFIGNTPVAYGDMLYVLGQACVYAYKFSNLSQAVWSEDFSAQSEDFLRGGGLYINGDRLAVTYGSNQIAVLDAQTGREFWRYELSSIARSAPLIHKGKVFVMTIDNKVYCFSLKDGLLQWTFDGIADQLSMINSLSMAAYNDMIIVPCATGQILLIKADSGDLIQNVSLDTKLSLVNHIHTLVVDQSFAYISSYQGSMYALNLKTGNVVWDTPLVGGGTLWPAGDYIYTINNNSQLIAVKRSSGGVKWVQDIPYKTLSGPILVNNDLYVTAYAGKLLVFSTTDGRQIREISIPKGRYAQPIAVKNQLLLLSDSGKLLELS
jgi:outer membrane protein assembly factor BamB